MQFKDVLHLKDKIYSHSNTEKTRFMVELAKKQMAKIGINRPEGVFQA